MLSATALNNAFQIEEDKYISTSCPARFAGIDRRDVSEGGRVDPNILDRAVRLLQLQSLDRYYSYHTRPRYGHVGIDVARSFLGVLSKLLFFQLSRLHAHPGCLGGY
ncbi:hypothetical protein EVAR_57074_1 [Eumeta japonica]|uniref:Uncharacterized protein n=1 Tax=Eumeta variegata TaxID=151549 RepID=A0A4C1YA47_EUMVA|nr:hypothetical protein EVAR_57074_1 [Eumeta japonica]